MKELICPICKCYSGFVNNILGYDAEQRYDIYECNNCQCSHMDIKEINKEIYNKIYQIPEKVGGYNRYIKYFITIPKEQEKLKWLSKIDHIYGPVYDFLKDKKGLSCLEIGCGLGYLTYAINEGGNYCMGYDISQEVIDKAKKQFQNIDFFVGDAFKELTDSSKQFDVIIATEVIEHLENYESFFRNCKKICKPGGVIILTTPNKSFYKKGSIWIGDLPPVHTTWRTPETFQIIANQYNFNTTFYTFSLKHTDRNFLYAKIYTNILVGDTSRPHFHTDIQQSISPKVSLFDNFKKMIDCIVQSSIIVKFSNVLMYILYGPQKSSPTIGCYYYNK